MQRDLGWNSPKGLKEHLLHSNRPDGELIKSKRPFWDTCFNQIGLPDYKDKDRLQRKLTIAVSNAEGFGLE